MFLEQIFELIGLGSSGHTCAHITGYFRDSTIASLRKIFEWIVILLKYCAEQGNLISLSGPNHLQNLKQKCKILNVFWT